MLDFDLENTFRLCAGSQSRLADEPTAEDNGVPPADLAHLLLAEHELPAGARPGASRSRQAGWEPGVTLYTLLFGAKPET